MYFKQFYLNCLAHASYLIGSDGEAAVVDPQRDVDQYLDEAAAQNLKIKYVIETHLHADFVSGHRELAARSGAQIIFGSQAKATIPHQAVREANDLTIGQQRKFNYALQPMTKEQFIKLLTADLPEAPAYFSKDAEINRTGADFLIGLPTATALPVAEVAKLARAGVIILDVREAADFGAGHVPGALNIGLGGQFASWAGSLISMAAPIVIVAASDEKVGEAQLRLARVGLENIQGYLAGGIEAWKEAGLELDVVPQINVAELKKLIATRPDLQIVDVRRPAEYES